MTIVVFGHPSVNLVRGSVAPWLRSSVALTFTVKYLLYTYIYSNAQYSSLQQYMYLYCSTFAVGATELRSYGATDEC